MPIRPEQRDRYPDDWRTISDRIRFDRAGSRCECIGECGTSHIETGGDGRCKRLHGQQIPGTAGQCTVLTVAHLNHRPEDCHDENLRAMCQACHLRYDADEHARNAKRTRLARETEGMDSLFDGGGT